MNLEKVIETEIDTAFLYHQMAKLSEVEELKIFYDKMSAIETAYPKKLSKQRRLKIKN